MSKITNEQVARLTEIIAKIDDVLYEEDTLSGVVEELVETTGSTDAENRDIEEAQIIVKNAAMQIDTAKDELFAAIDLLNKVLHNALVVEEEEAR